jgi:release factor glutamine methyltransferase
MTVQQATQQLLFQLFDIYEEREAKNIANLVMEKVTEWKRIDRIMNKETTLSAGKEKLLTTYISELLNHRPVQYVLNEAWFYGIKLYVNDHVLIPRPETEELVDWIIKDIPGTTANSNSKNLQILDVGTGSGCIALALKKQLSFAEVFAIDVSKKALAVADKNSRSLDISVNFIEGDFLNKEDARRLPKVDIISSNPPYIPLGDKVSMLPNVLLHEPHLALFVEDRDPLIFYKALADFSRSHLKPGGSLYVETHEQMATQVKELFIQTGFDMVEIKIDMQGKERMVKAAFLKLPAL